MIPRLVMAGDRMPAADLAGLPGVEIWRTAVGVPIAYGAVVEGRHCIDIPGVARFRFRHRHGSVVAQPDRAAAPARVEDAYRRTVLPLVMQVRGREVLHASAVRSRGGVVAFCADSGTGKSTLAAALVERGYQPWADDAMVVDTSRIPVVTARLPFRFHLRQTSMTSFHQELLAAVSEANSAEEGEAEPLPLAALCLLSRAPRVPGAVATERLQRSVALTALLGHAYCFSLQDTRRKRRMLAHYAYLATQVPVFALRIESGPDVLPEVLQRLDEWMRAAFVR